MPGQDFLKAMAGMNLENSEDFSFMPLMQTMMKNLLSKDVLYPALKDLREKVQTSTFFLFFFWGGGGGISSSSLVCVINP